jgi:hypothetical protein
VVVCPFSLLSYVGCLKCLALFKFVSKESFIFSRKNWVCLSSVVQWVLGFSNTMKLKLIYTKMSAQ